MGMPCLKVINSDASQAFMHQYENLKRKILITVPVYTGLFISPSGISDPCGTVAGMVTPKGSMSTEGETLQVCVLPYRCSICAPLLICEGS